MNTRAKSSLRVRATPKAARNAIQGLHEAALKVTVQAPPENGKANEAIRKLLAKVLGLRLAQVELKSGQSSRSKRFVIDGLTKQELEARIEKGNRERESEMTEPDLYSRIEEASQCIRGHFHMHPEFGIVLGTGLGGLAEKIEDSVTIPYAEIPHFPQTRVESHSGNPVPRHRRR